MVISSIAEMRCLMQQYKWGVGSQEAARREISRFRVVQMRRLLQAHRG